MMQRDCQRGPLGKDDNYHSAFAILNFDYRCLHLWKFDALSVDQIEPVDPRSEDQWSAVRLLSVTAAWLIPKRAAAPFLGDVF